MSGVAEPGPDAADFWDGIPALLYAMRPDGRLVAATDRWCAAVGFERGAVIGRPEDTLLADEVRPLAAEVREALLIDGRVDGVPYDVVRADGSVLEVLFSAAVRVAASGERRIVAHWTDLTERARMQQALDDRDADLRRLTRAASHDLQEPLRDVMGHLQRINDDYGDALDARGRRSLETAVLGGARMRRSVVALRTYSRLMGRGPGQAPVELCRMVQRAVEARAAGALFEGPGARPADGLDASGVADPRGAVRVYLGAVPRLLGDGRQLELLIHEIVDNAFAFAADRPLRLHFDARAVGRRLRVALTDNGIGLDPAQRGRAFGLFTRFEPARAPDGAGMGLALCRRVAENHAAGIALASGAFGGGLRVVLDWPAERISPPDS